MAIDTFWPWRVAFKKLYAEATDIANLVADKITVKGQAILGSALVQGSAEVKGSIDVDGNADVGGDLAVGDDLSVTGDLTVGGILNVTLPPNSSEKSVTKTAGTTKFAEGLAAKTEVVKLRYVITEKFEGCTMELGDGSTVDAFITDANFPKDVGSGVVSIAKVPTSAFDIVLTVGSGGTSGAGWFKVEWSP